MSVQVPILVANADTLVSLGFTRVEVWQSKDDGNSFQEVTASVAAAAFLLSLPALTTFRMGGHQLRVKINGGSEQSISFDPGADTWTPAQVVSRINTVVAGLASLVGSQVQLTSPTTGRVSSLQVTYCDAHDLFDGASPVVFGLAARPTLVTGTYVYTFPDVAGIATDRYQWRFSANGVNPISAFSKWVYGTSTPLIASNLLSVCAATFIDGAGQPLDTKVIISVLDVPQSIAGFLVSGSKALIYATDENGFMQFTLVRGAKVRAAVENTTFVREFVVPNTATFDLLAVMAAATDTFTIQTVPPLLIRRSI